MEEDVKGRLIEAAKAQKGDPAWRIIVLPEGIRITYTWQQMIFHPFTSRPISGNHHTVESCTTWRVIQRESEDNPLLIAMDDLVKQKMEFKS